jgi:hypothetical protein
LFFFLFFFFLFFFARSLAWLLDFASTTECRMPPKRASVPSENLFLFLFYLFLKGGEIFCRMAGKKRISFRTRKRLYDSGQVELTRARVRLLSHGGAGDGDGLLRDFMISSTSTLRRRISPGRTVAQDKPSPGQLGLAVDGGLAINQTKKKNSAPRLVASRRPMAMRRRRVHTASDFSPAMQYINRWPLSSTAHCFDGGRMVLAPGTLLAQKTN